MQSDKMDLTKLKQFRAAAKAGITKSVKDIEHFVQVASIHDIIAKKVSINKALQNISNYNDKIYEQYDFDVAAARIESEMIEDFAYEEKVQSYLSILASAQQSKGPNTTAQPQKAVVKLPALTLPKFGGEVTL